MENTVDTQKAIYDLQALSGLRNRARHSNDSATIDAVAKQFESLFLDMMLKSMRKASIGDPIFGGGNSEFFRDLHDQQIVAGLAARGGIGLSKMLAKYMTRQAGNSDKPINEDSILGKQAAPRQDENGIKPSEKVGQSEVSTKSKNQKQTEDVETITTLLDSTVAQRRAARYLGLLIG